MSNDHVEEAIELNRDDPAAAFSALMGFLDTEEAGEETGESGEAIQASADPDGLPASEAEGAGRAPTADEPAGAGDGGEPELPDASGGDEPGAEPSGHAWTIDSGSLDETWGEVSEAIETELGKLYANEALEEVKNEHGKYFEEMQKHPRLLVGAEVPSVTGDGMEVLRDSEDAREWQEAVKSLLMAEVSARADRLRESMSGTMETLHSSVDLFRNNADLVPGTKQFNMELANRFAKMAKDYEVRVEGKLVGYSVPVQPLINNIRTQIVSERQAPPAAPAQVAPKRSTPAKKPSPRAETPQAGIPSKAGAAGGSSGSDFSALFGTLGLPDLVI